MNLERARATHDRAQSAKAQAIIRVRVRQHCERSGVAVPPWAALQREGRKHVGLSFVARPKYAKGQGPVVATLEIPPELSQWRARGYGRVVCMSLDGAVRLHEYGQPIRKYPSVVAALAAVA